MKTTIAACLLAVLTLFGAHLHAGAPERVRVLSMMAKVPEKAHQSRPGRYETMRDAPEIADAIAAASSSDKAASDAVVFAAYESSNSKTDANGECLGGDPDPVTGEFRSWGVFQLSALSVPKSVACDPKQAAVAWMKLRADALRVCASSPPEDRLAWLAAGSCTNRGGLKESRFRTHVAEQVLEAVSP
jgi:hypothetical protein